LHVLPGESVLEIGAGSGLWTEQLAHALRGESPITAAVFDPRLAAAAERRRLPNTRVVLLETLDELPPASFDHIVTLGILCPENGAATLAAVRKLLKPGGHLVSFEPNYWSPREVLARGLRTLGVRHETDCCRALRRLSLVNAASREGFDRVHFIPYDIVPANTPRRLLDAMMSAAYILEHAPLVRELCGWTCVWLTRPGSSVPSRVDLATHPHLFGSISIVVPCHNEEMNVRRLIDALLAMYDAYVHEIIIVDDNSTDGTAQVVAEAMRADPRVKLIRRGPPNGVGRALRDGYAAATGRYILTMDSDFEVLVPELRDLFDSVAAGRDGAIGSRFSYDSVLVNYPFLKILCNRAFHVLVRWTLLPGVRDISNNLKLYRAEILKALEIEEPHFAANVETGLKPLLAGFDIEEVPASWINRTPGMGSSSFRILNVAPGYVVALGRTIWRSWRGHHAGGTPIARCGTAAD
jgi:SAM-dependent methyltransferase